jgi:hypothetical protein
MRESGARLVRAAGVRPARRPHAIGRAARVRGAIGSRVLMQPVDRSRAPVPTRWRASADARGARLRRLGGDHGRTRAELDLKSDTARRSRVGLARD